MDPEVELTEPLKNRPKELKKERIIESSSFKVDSRDSQ